MLTTTQRLDADLQPMPGCGARRSSIVAIAAMPCTDHTADAWYFAADDFVRATKHQRPREPRTG